MLTLPLLAASAPAANPKKPSPPLELSVDATEAPRRLLHVSMSIPVPKSGAPAKATSIELAYPKWIPGEHGPTGPIVNLVSLHVAANGSEIPWHRDPVDLYRFRIDVPAGVSALDVKFDTLTPVEKEGFSFAASSSDRLALLSWNQLLLYPAGAASASVRVKASLRLPDGWKWASALESEGDAAGPIRFREVSLETLVDSPVLAGRHLRVVELGGDPLRPHRLAMAADSDAALRIPDDVKAKYDRLVAEAGKLFGARHYRSYTFLLTLSDAVAHFGLEHHESSDDRLGERSIVDEDLRKITAGLLPHEMVHSWNGKYRRPADLATADFGTPMRSNLLWVYEGLTNYLGFVLTARSGLRTPEQSREDLAETAEWAANRGGRAWRPLEDTAISAQILYGASPYWENLRRSVDFYGEGTLLWLDADVLIREKSGGTKSLDDFCHAFFGAPDGPPEVRTYGYRDVVDALAKVQPYDWDGFFAERVLRAAPKAPLGGIERGGWKLGFVEKPGELLQAREDEDEGIDVTASIGLALDKEKKIVDVVPGGPADRAGIAPGMHVVAVDGRKVTAKVLRTAIADHRGKSEPIELLTESAEFYRTYKVNWSGGERYPKLGRNEGSADLLSAILAPAGGM